MTIYAVSVHHRTHTCPADTDPHPVDTTQQVVHVTPGGSCLTLAVVRLADTTVTIPCGRRYPHHRQCPACRIAVTTQAVTVEHLGHTTGHHSPAPTGHAAQPCTVCRRPLAAVLADLGRHILCHPHTDTRGQA